MTVKTVPILTGSLLLGLFFDFLFYGHAPGISLVLYVLVIYVVTLGLMQYHKKRLPLAWAGLAIATMFFAVMVMVRANDFLTFLNIVAVLSLLLLSLDVAMPPVRRLRQYSLQNYINPILGLPLQALDFVISATQRLIATPRKPTANKQSITPIIRGLLLAAPLLFIFVLLLTSADGVFAHYVDSLFSFQMPANLYPHLILIGFMTIMFVGAYGLLLARKPPATATAKQTAGRKLGLTEAYIVLGSVGILFALFVLIQITYLFGGQSHVLQQAGLTYADYARKGFFELVVVAVLSLGLILELYSITSRPTKRDAQIYRWLNIGLIAEVMIIMVSALKRLHLYEQAYGFTGMRFYAHAFIFWLALLFVLVVIHLLRSQRQNILAFQIFVSLIGLLFVLNVINPDAIIARQNINRYNQTGKVDAGYLGNLSDDAMPELVKALPKNDQLSKDLTSSLKTRYPGPRSWKSYNVAHSRGADIRAEYWADTTQRPLK